MPIFDTSTYEGKAGAIKLVNELLEEKAVIEIKKSKKTRSGAQNRALHKYFGLISEQLNEMGMEFVYTGIRGKELSMPYSSTIVKDYFWRPLQIHLFKKESTTQITTKEMNEIIEIIGKFFAEKGVDLPFPSIESIMSHYENHG